MYDLSDYDYEIPAKLIAQKPIGRRDNSRLLTVDRGTENINITKFRDITDYFSEGDVLVLNETKVIPARLFGRSERNSEVIEIFLLKEIEENVWEIMVRPGRKVKNGDRIILDDNVFCRVQKSNGEGSSTAVFECDRDLYEFISTKGKIPLPPYINREPVESDKTRYQTVFAKIPGAVAAPTAGLHFTPALLQKLAGKGVDIVKILLHVGEATFKPMKAKTITDHKMHSEYYEISQESAERINSARANGKKIFAVGTTVVRTLETMSDANGQLRPGSGETDIFIYPGYKFKITDHIITNFHLPKSTLILLVAAFSSLDLIKKAYSTAVKEKMRFFSYGDAMLII
jgi:S-adenosylmethionine:tRNA ribosyltransferase-isomerase